MEFWVSDLDKDLSSVVYMCFFYLKYDLKGATESQNIDFWFTCPDFSIIFDNIDYIGKLDSPCLYFGAAFVVKDFFEVLSF